MNEEMATAAIFGPDQPERFLTAWFGSPPRDAPEWVANGLPVALVEWHRQVARWDSPVMQQNSVPFQRTMDDDVMLVGIENQRVWLWGVREAGDNPRVWERHNAAEDGWTETGERLDEFLWHFTLTDAVVGARFGLVAIDVTSTDHRNFTGGWTALDAEPWRWPGPSSALWTRGGLIAWTMVNSEPDTPVDESSRYNIVVGALSQEDLFQADDAGIAWEWDSRANSTNSRRRAR